MTTQTGINKNEILKMFTKYNISEFKPTSVVKTAKGLEWLLLNLQKVENKLLELYDPKKIIFVDMPPAKFFVRKDGGLGKFTNDFEEMEMLLDICTKHFVKRVSPHVVKMPLNLLGDENHQWGNGIWHYTKETYSFLLSCFTIIMGEKFERSEIDKKMANLRDKFELFLSEQMRVCKENEQNLLAKRARIDMKVFGKTESRVSLKTSDETAFVEFPAWFCDAKGSGSTIVSTAKELKIEAVSNSKGEFCMWLRGVDERSMHDKNRRIPRFVRFTSVFVNGVEILDAPKTVWHDEPFCFKKQVVKDEIVKIVAKWEEVV